MNFSKPFTFVSNNYSIKKPAQNRFSLSNILSNYGAGDTRCARLPALFRCIINTQLMEQRNGAGDRNRTDAISLEGWSSTIELHPRTKTIITYPKQNIKQIFT